MGWGSEAEIRLRLSSAKLLTGTGTGTELGKNVYSTISRMYFNKYHKDVPKIVKNEP